MSYWSGVGGFDMKVFPARGIGFRPRNEIAYRVFNFCAAAVLIALTLPLFLTISLLLLVTQGREIVYRGTRLGEDQKPFRILKFRTLCSTRAQALTYNCTLPIGANIETPLGNLLRESRLDELPQLFNILMGDMNICGPRPVRPEIAAIERERIRDYDLRFTVKPGLIGPTQACFGHGASKRVRARMNNRLVRRPVSIPAELGLLGCIAMSVLARIGRKIGHAMLRTASVSKPRRDMWLAMEDGDRMCQVESIGMRRIGVQGVTGGMVSGTAVLYIRLRSGALRKARVILSDSESHGVFNYSAETEFGEFIIERYALGLVVVPPKVGSLRTREDSVREFEQACA